MSEPSQTPPPIDLIIPAYNAGRTLARCVQALLAQRGPFAVRVVVVDDGSTDATADIVREIPGCELVRLPRNAGIAAARNAGLAAGRAPVVGFVDSDIVVEPGWLAALLVALDAGAAVACGLVLPAHPERDVFHHFDRVCTERTFRGLDGPLPAPQYQVMPFNYVFRRSVFDEVGRFDERFTRNAEDTDLLQRCASCHLPVHLVPAAMARHEYEVENALAYARKLRRVGREGLKFHLKWRTGYLGVKLLAALLAALCLWAYYPMTVLFGIEQRWSNSRLRQGRRPTMLELEWRLFVRYFKALGEAQTFARAAVDRSLWSRKP